MGVDRPRASGARQDDFAYGGDFGEPLHDGNFVVDGLVFPDRTPSPGLVEFKAVIAPVRIIGDATGIENLHLFRDLSHLTFAWALEVEGEPIAEGTLDPGPVPPGETAPLPEPELPPVPGGPRGVADGAGAARGGRAVGAGRARGRLRPAAGGRRRRRRPPRRQRRPRRAGDRIALGPGVFDAATGRLVRLGSLALDGPRLDVWRAPIDNDVRTHGPEPLAAEWRAAGLHRMRHRVLRVDVQDGAPSCGRGSRRRARTARCSRASPGRRTGTRSPARSPSSRRASGRSRCPGSASGWRCPAALGRLEWFGLGPGEAYADIALRRARRALRRDRRRPPDAVRAAPGERHRAEVRWAELTGGDGSGLRVEGRPHVDVTARRWTSEDLDAARTRADLVPRDRVWLNVDLAQHGLGSGACGPAVLPPHRLEPRRAAYTFTLRALA